MRISTTGPLAALAIVMAMPLAAQDTAAPEPPPMPPPEAIADPYEPTPDQQAMLDGWPEDRRLAYNEWTSAEQAYFWSLSEARQETYFALTPGARAALGEMDEASREAAWSDLESRMDAMNAPPPVTDGPAPDGPMSEPPPPPPAPPPTMDDESPDEGHGAVPEPR